MGAGGAQEGSSRDLDMGSAAEGGGHHWQGELRSLGWESPPGAGSDPAQGQGPREQQSSSQARVTQSKWGDRTSARGEGTLPAGPVPGAGGPWEGQGLAEQRGPAPCPASRPLLHPAQV